MLVNEISGMDFKKKLQITIVLSVLLIILGIASTMLVCFDKIGAPETDLIDDLNTFEFTQGFYIGTGLGLICAGLVTLIKNVLCLKNKENFKIAETAYNDERNKFIKNKMWSISGIVMLFALYIALLISGLFNIIVLKTLVIVLGTFGIIILITKIVLNKIY